MENEDIRKRARSAFIPLWKIAERLEISEPTLTRWLRVPISSEKKQMILSAINDLEKEGVTI